MTEELPSGIIGSSKNIVDPLNCVLPQMYVFTYSWYS